MNAALPAQPAASPLLDVILGFLAPILLAAGVADIQLARLAAQEAIAAYQTGGQGNLVTIAQVVGFAIASLDALRLSAAPDASLSMKLKLRGNANALSRSTQRSLQTHTPPASTNDEPAHAEALAALEQAQTLQAQTRQAQTRQAETLQAQTPERPSDPDRQRELAWADAMTDVAAESAREFARLPPEQRRTQTIRIAALSAMARDLRLGHPPLPTPHSGTPPSGARPSGTPGQHPPQQGIAQHELMIQRPEDMQTDQHQQHDRQVHVQVPHRMPPL